MAQACCYPAELYLNPLLIPLGGETLEAFREVYFILLEGFDEFHMFDERRLIQADPEDYWRYIKLGRFGSDEDIRKYIGEIVERFKKVNAESKVIRRDDFFKFPEDVVSSYFFRDAMMVRRLPVDIANKVYNEGDVIFDEFKATKESPTLKAIIGEEEYEKVIKPYRGKPFAGLKKRWELPKHLQ